MWINRLVRNPPAPRSRRDAGVHHANLRLSVWQWVSDAALQFGYDITSKEERPRGNTVGH
jgi:hypothetical protein